MNKNLKTSSIFVALGIAGIVLSGCSTTPPNPGEPSSPAASSSESPEPTPGASSTPTEGTEKTLPPIVIDEETKTVNANVGDFIYVATRNVTKVTVKDIQILEPVQPKTVDGVKYTGGASAIGEGSTTLTALLSNGTSYDVKVNVVEEKLVNGIE